MKTLEWILDLDLSSQQKGILYSIYILDNNEKK